MAEKGPATKYALSRDLGIPRATLYLDVRMLEKRLIKEKECELTRTGVRKKILS